MATMLWEESTDDAQAAEVWADVDVQDSQFGLLREPEFKAFSAADAELLESDWSDSEPLMVTMLESDWGDSEPLMRTMFLEESPDDMKHQYEWEEVTVQDGDIDVLGEPMLMAFSVLDEEMLEADWGYDEPLMRTMFLEESSDDMQHQYLWEDASLQDGDVGVLEEPMLMAFSAADAAVEEPLFRTLTTADAEVLATDWNEADVGLSDDDGLDAEIMLLSASGPSPWQNLDSPEDVNADGWATPIDVLLIINGIGQDVTFSTSLSLPVSLFLDVNGDRHVDASDAIQVVNLLNAGEQSEPAADLAGDETSLWYADRWAAPSVWEGHEDSDQAVSETGEDAAEIDDTPWAVARVMQRDDESEDLDQDDADEQLFSEDADWLFGELL
jgi:hypothetical protein